MSDNGRPVLGPRTEPPDRGCSVEGCDRRHHGRGLCQKHWATAYYWANHEEQLELRRELRRRREARAAAGDNDNQGRIA